MTLAQVVALGTLPGLATSKTPLADAAALFLGASGAALITLGAICSTSGNNMGRRCPGRATSTRWPSRAICRRSSAASTPASGRRPTRSW